MAATNKAIISSSTYDRERIARVTTSSTIISENSHDQRPTEPIITTHCTANDNRMIAEYLNYEVGTVSNRELRVELIEPGADLTEIRRFVTGASSSTCRSASRFLTRCNIA